MDDPDFGRLLNLLTFLLNPTGVSPIGIHSLQQLRFPRK